MIPSRSVLGALARHADAVAPLPRRAWTMVQSEILDECLALLRAAGVEVEHVLEGTWSEHMLVISGHPGLPEARPGAALRPVAITVETKRDGRKLIKEFVPR